MKSELVSLGINAAVQRQNVIGIFGPYPLAVGSSARLQHVVLVGGFGYSNYEH